TARCNVTALQPRCDWKRALDSFTGTSRTPTGSIWCPLSLNTWVVERCLSREADGRMGGAMIESYHLQEEGMDVLVMLEENPDHSPVLAHVNSVPSPLASAERPSRDIVTLYGAPSPESLALALAAAVECHRAGEVNLAA